MRPKLKFFLAVGLLVLGLTSAEGQTISWINTGASTAWYTAANWSPSTAAGAWTTANLAQFNNSGTANTSGINMGTASLSIGAIEMSSARTRNLTIGNSSTTSGTLTLNSIVVNTLADTILFNGSANTLTLQNNETGSGKTMNVALAGTTNTIRANSTGAINISSNISGTATNSLVIQSAGSGAVTISGTNTYAGTTTVDTGSLFVNGNNAGATGAIGVNNTSTLGGTGTLGGATTVASGGTIRGGVGAAAGNLTTGNVTVNNGGILFANLAAVGTSSKLLLGGNTLDLKTGAILKLDDITGFVASAAGIWNIAELTSGATLQLDAVGVANGFQYGKYTQGTGNTGPVNIDVSSLPTLGTGDQLILTRTGNNLVLEFIPVPEPTTMLGLAVGLIGLGAAVRKKFFAPALSA
jgi:fibronectin-binding autotransporter adhesin